MNTKQPKSFQSMALPAILSIALVSMLAGCDRAQQTIDSAGTPAQVSPPAGDQQTLGQVQEFDGFTLRANLSRTEFLPDAMAREYGIEARPDLVLLNLVVLENRPDRRPEPVSAEVSVHYESLIGHAETIEMRAAEADGLISYIGTLDASAQRVFRFVIEARPEGVDEPLQMTFEAQLDSLNVD